MDKTPVQQLAEWFDVLGWFDPIFFVYNLLLFAVALLIPPLITIVYVKSCAARSCDGSPVTCRRRCGLPTSVRSPR